MKLLNVAALASASKVCSSASARIGGAKRIEEKIELRSLRIFLPLSSNDPHS
jgi:hypothetical protein